MSEVITSIFVHNVVVPLFCFIGDSTSRVNTKRVSRKQRTVTLPAHLVDYPSL